MNKRAVITGIGVVAPGGIGTKAYWQMLTMGRTATRIIQLCDPTPFRSRVGAECDFDPQAAGLTPHGRLNGWLTGLGCWFLEWRSRRLVAAGS